MKTATVILAVAVWFGIQSKREGDAAVIKRLNERWLNAIQQKDTAALSSVLADDFVLVNPGGNKTTKADNLANILLPGQTIESINIDSVEVRIIDNNTGILTAWTTFNVNVNGKTSIGKNCYQDIYEKRNSVWKAVAAHVTLPGM